MGKAAMLSKGTEREGQEVPLQEAGGGETGVGSGRLEWIAWVWQSDQSPTRSLHSAMALRNCSGQRTNSAPAIPFFPPSNPRGGPVLNV